MRGVVEFIDASPHGILLSDHCRDPKKIALHITDIKDAKADARLRELNWDVWYKRKKDVPVLAQGLITGTIKAGPNESFGIEITTIDNLHLQHIKGREDLRWLWDEKRPSK